VTAGRAHGRGMDLMQVERALRSGDLALAETLCRKGLQREPRNAPAVLLLARIGLGLGRIAEAESLLAYCLEIAPGFPPAHAGYAELLFRTQRYVDALQQIDEALAKEPDEPSHLLLKGAILSQYGRTDAALAIFDAVLERNPDEARIHLNRGRALQTAGRHAKAVSAFRSALAVDRRLAEAWWSLSDLKTFRFDEADVAQMRTRLADGTTSDEERTYLSFALGKALEDRRVFDESFRHYATGNALKRQTVSWNPDRHHADVDMITELFDTDFFAERQDWGYASPAAIFVVGLPRAGSTLLEQILASHSRVDGTMELPDIMSMAARLDARTPGARRGRFRKAVTSLTRQDCAALGAEYLRRTLPHRGSATFFVDKMPNNFMHVGLIHLILPHATIIDARRHPMACGFSLFRQLFSNGQAFSYDLDEIGRYYSDYVRLMSHWETVLPGRVLRVDYEAVVTDTENQVRRVLAHSGLDFEPGCLDFHRTERQVRTASSEQVRQPLYRHAVAHWRNYEPHLRRLREALGPMAADVPNVPRDSYRPRR